MNNVANFLPKNVYFSSIFFIFRLFFVSLQPKDQWNRRSGFSSKCGVKNIDLDKKRVFFFQMWGKNHRFGQKTQNLFAQFKKIYYLCGELKLKVVWKT